jgi:hypothetical protein
VQAKNWVIFGTTKPRMELLVRIVASAEKSIISFFFFFFFSSDGGESGTNQNLVLEQTKEATNFIPYLNRSY